MLPNGTILSGYRIDGVVGQGGMGVVYEATQLSLNRTVALKLLAAHLGSDIAFRERFRREGQIQAGLDHAHIITVYEAGDDEHGLFIAMRLVRGLNLKDMIVGRELDAGRTLRILAPVADALDAAHGAGLIHRDIKPQNILVGGRDHPFLADFGLTKAPGEKSLTRTGQFVGTLDYVSPEQIQDRPATIRSDIYALAAVLYECLTGIVPYPKESEAAVLYAHMADPPPRVSDHRPDLPIGLDDVIAGAMAKNPEERPPSASDLLLETERAFTRRLRAAMTPPGPIEALAETGIRDAEINVPTREARAAELRALTPPPETVAPAAETAAESVDEATITPPAETAAEPVAEATIAPPGETAAEETYDPGTPARDETAAEPGATQAAPVPDSAEIAEPGATQAAPVPDSADFSTSGAGVAASSAPASTAAPSTAAAPAAPARRAFPLGLSPALTAIGLAGVLVAVIAGFFLGQSGGDKSASGFDNVATSGSLAVKFPDDWRRSATRPAIPGLEFKDPLALGPTARAAQDTLITGQVAATGPSLLPRSFTRLLPKTPARDDTVLLGKLEAYRYRDVRPRGFDKPLTLYVSPTSAGVATVACVGGASNAFPRDCDRVAATLEFSDGKAFALGPDTDYAKGLDKTIDGLNAARTDGRKRLSNANTPGGQAATSEDLAHAYRVAAGRAAKLEVSPAAQDSHSALVAALKRAAGGYDVMASAARSDKRGQYDSGAEDVRRADAALKDALDQLRKLGYSVE